MFDRVASPGNGPEIFRFRKDVNDHSITFKVADPALLPTDQDKEKCFYSIWSREKAFLKGNAVVEVTGVNFEAGATSYTFRTADAEGCLTKKAEEDAHTVSSVFKACKKSIAQQKLVIGQGPGINLSESEKAQADCRIWEKSGKRFRDIRLAREIDNDINVEITQVEDDGYTYYSKEFLMEFSELKRNNNYQFDAANGVAFRTPEERTLCEYSIWQSRGGLLAENAHFVITGVANGRITYYELTNFPEKDGDQFRMVDFSKTPHLTEHEKVFAKRSLFAHDPEAQHFVLLGFDPVNKRFSYFVKDKANQYADERNVKGIHFHQAPLEQAQIAIWESIKEGEPPAGTIHILSDRDDACDFIFAPNCNDRAIKQKIQFAYHHYDVLNEAVYDAILTKEGEDFESANVVVLGKQHNGNYSYSVSPKMEKSVTIDQYAPHPAAPNHIRFNGTYAYDSSVRNAIWAQIKDEVPPDASISIEHDYDHSQFNYNKYKVTINLPPQVKEVALTVRTAQKPSIAAPQRIDIEVAAATKPTEKTEGKGHRPEEYKINRIALEQIKQTSFEWSLFNVLYAILEFLFSPFVMAYSALFSAKDHDKALALFTGDHKLGVISNHKMLLSQLEMITDLFESEGAETPALEFLKEATKSGRLLHDALHIDSMVYEEEEARNWREGSPTAKERLSQVGASLWYRLSCQDKTAFKDFAIGELNAKMPKEDGEHFLLPIGIGENENYAPHFLLFYKQEGRLKLKHIQYSPPHLQKKFTAVTTHDLGSVDTREFIKDLVHLQTLDTQTLASPEKAAARLDNTLAMFIAQKIKERNDEIEVEGGDDDEKGKVAVLEERQKGSLDPVKLIRNALVEAHLESEDEEVQEKLNDLIGTKEAFLRHYVNHLVKFLEKNESGFTTAEKIKVLQSIKYYGKQLNHHLAKELNKGDGIHGAIIAKDVTEDLLENVSVRLNEQMRILEMERNDVRNLDGKVNLFSLNLEGTIEDTMTADKPAAVKAAKVDTLALDPVQMKEIEAMHQALHTGNNDVKEDRNALLQKFYDQSQVVAKMLELGQVKAAKMQAFALLRALPPPVNADRTPSFWDKLNSAKEIENWSGAIYDLSERFFEAALRAGETPLAQDDVIVFNMATRLTLVRLYERYGTFFPNGFEASIEGFGQIAPSIDQMFNVKTAFIALHEMPVYLGREAAILETDEVATALRDIIQRDMGNTDHPTFHAYLAQIKTTMKDTCVMRAQAQGLDTNDKGVQDGIDKIVNGVLKEKFGDLAHAYITFLTGIVGFAGTGNLWNAFKTALAAPRSSSEEDLKPVKEQIETAFSKVLKDFTEAVVQNTADDKKAAFKAQLTRLPRLYQLKDFFIAQRKDQVKRAETERLMEKWAKEDEEEGRQIENRRQEIARYDTALRRHEQADAKFQAYMTEMRAWAQGAGAKPRWPLGRSNFPQELERHFQAKQTLPTLAAIHAQEVAALRARLQDYVDGVIATYDSKMAEERAKPLGERLEYQIDSQLPRWEGPEKFDDKIKAKYRTRRSQASMGWAPAPQTHDRILRDLIDDEIASLEGRQRRVLHDVTNRANNEPAGYDVPPKPAGNRPNEIIARKIREPEVLSAERQVELANAIKNGLANDRFLSQVDALAYNRLATTQFWFTDAYALNDEMQAFCGHLAREMGVSKESYTETLYALKGKIANALDPQTRHAPQKLLMTQDNSLTNFGSRTEMATLRKNCAFYVDEVIAKDQTEQLKDKNKINFLIGYNDRRVSGDGLKHIPPKGRFAKDENAIFENQVALSSIGYGLSTETDGIDLLAARHISRIFKFGAMAAVLENPEAHVEKYRWTNFSAAFNAFSTLTNDGLREDLKAQDRIFLVSAVQGKDITGNRISTENRAFVLSSQRDSASGTYCTRPNQSSLHESRTASRKQLIGSQSVALADFHGADDYERQFLHQINLLHRPARGYDEEQRKAAIEKNGDMGLMSQQKTMREFLLRTSAVVDGHAKNLSDHPFSWYTVIFTLNCIRDMSDELVDETWGRQVRDKLISNVFQAGLIEEALANNPEFFITAIPYLTELLSHYSSEKQREKESDPARFDAAALCIHNICDKIRKAAVVMKEKGTLREALFDQINDLLPKDYKGKIEGFRANTGPFQRLFALAHLEYFRDNQKDLFKSFGSSDDWLSILRSHAIVMQVASEEGHTGVQEEVRHHFHINLMPSIEEFLHRDVTDKKQRDRVLSTIAGMAPCDWIATKKPYQYKTIVGGQIKILDLQTIEQTPEVRGLIKEINEFEKARNKFLTELAGLSSKVEDPRWTWSDAKPYEYSLKREDGSTHVLNISTGEGVALNGELENRGGLPQQILDHDDFKFLFGNKNRTGMGWKTPPIRGDVIEYKWRDQAAEINYLIRFNKKDKTFQIFQEIYKEHARDDEKPTLFRFTRLKIDESLLSMSFNQNNSRVENLISQKGAWVRLDSNDRPEKDRVYVAQFGHKIDKDQIRLHVRNNLVTKGAKITGASVGEGSNRKWVVSSLEKGAAPLLPFKNLEHTLLLSTDGSHVDEIRFFKPPTDGAATDTNAYYLALRRNEHNRNQWDVVNRKGWKWQLHQTAHLEKQFGENWRENSLHLVNTETAEEEHWFFPYIVVGNEKSGSSVQYMKNMLQFVDLLKEMFDSGLTTMGTSSEELNKKAKDFFTYFFKDVFQNSNAHELAPNKMEWGELVAQEFFNEVMEAPFDIIRAVFGSAIEAYNDKKAAIMKKVLLKAHDYQAAIAERFADAANPGDPAAARALAHAEMERLLDDKMKKFQGDLNKFFKGILSPAPLKIGNSGQSGSHAAFLYQAHVAATRGEFAVASDYLERMVTKGVSNNEDDVEQLEFLLTKVLLKESLTQVIQGQLAHPVGLSQTAFQLKLLLSLKQVTPKLEVQHKRPIGSLLTKLLSQFDTSKFQMGNDGVNPAKLSGDLAETVILSSLANEYRAKLKTKKGELQSNGLLLTRKEDELLRRQVPLDIFTLFDVNDKNSLLSILPADQQEQVKQVMKLVGVAEKSAVVGKHKFVVPTAKEVNTLMRTITQNMNADQMVDIRELHKKKGSYPKWETLIANFYSYMHWIYYNDVKPEELSFLMAEIPLLTRHRAQIETARNLLLLFYHHRQSPYFEQRDDQGLFANRDDFTDALKKIQTLASQFGSDEVEENIRAYRRHAAEHPSLTDVTQWGMYRVWGSTSKWLKQSGDNVQVGPKKQADHGPFSELHNACVKVLHKHLLDHYEGDKGDITLRGGLLDAVEAPVIVPVDRADAADVAAKLTPDELAKLPAKDRIWHGPEGSRIQAPLKILLNGLVASFGNIPNKDKVVEKVCSQLKVHVDSLLDHDDFYSGYKEFTEVLACFAEWMLAMSPDKQQSSVAGILRATQDPNFQPAQYNGSPVKLTVVLQQLSSLKTSLNKAFDEYQKTKPPSKAVANNKKQDIAIDESLQNKANWDVLFGRTDVVEDGELNPVWEDKLKTEVDIIEQQLAALDDSTDMEKHYLRKLIDGAKKSSHEERRYKCTRTLTVPELTPLSKQINERLSHLNKEIAEVQAEIDMLVRANSESLEIVSLIACADQLGRTQEGNRLSRRIFNLVLEKYKEGKIKSPELDSKLTHLLLASTERDQLKKAQDVVKAMYGRVDSMAKGLDYSMDELDLAKAVQEKCDSDILWLLMSHDLHQFLSEGSDRLRYAKKTVDGRYVLDQPSIYRKYLLVDFERKQIARLKAKESIEKIVNGQPRPIIVATRAQIDQIQGVFRRPVLGITEATSAFAIKGKKEAFVTRAEFEGLSALQDSLYQKNPKDERIFALTELKKRLHVIESKPITIEALDPQDVAKTVDNLRKNDELLLLTPEEFAAVKHQIKDHNQVVTFKHDMSLAGIFAATTKKVHFDKVRMGVGKSTNIFPISTKILLERGYEPVVVTTEELLMQLRDFMDEKAFIFEFNISYGLTQEDSKKDDKVIAHLTKLRDTLNSLKSEGRYCLITPARLGFIRNKRAELDNQLLFLQAESPEEKKCFEKLQLLKQISSYFWREAPSGLVPRPGVVFLEDEDVVRKVTKEYNYAIGDRGPVDRYFFNMFHKFVSEMMQYQDENGEYKFRDLLLNNALRSLSDITEELIPVLEKLYDDTDFWQNKEVGWKNWKLIDKQQFIDYITGKSNDIPKGVRENTAMTGGDPALIYNQADFWRGVGLAKSKLSLTLDEFKAFLKDKTMPDGHRDLEEKAILEKLYVCYDYWKKVGGVFNQKEASEYIRGKRKDPPQGMQHTNFLAALRSLLTNKNGTMGAVYHINADMSRGFDPNNHCEVMPYSDGMPKPNHMFGVVKEYILHHLFQYAAAVGDKGIDEDLFWNFSKDLLKNHNNEAISGLDPNNTWADWHDRLAKRSMLLPNKEDKGNKYKAFISPECFEERMQLLRYLMFESPYMKIYHQQVICNSQDVTLGHKPIMASGTGDPWSLNLDDDDHDGSAEPDMIMGETLLGLFSLKDGYNGLSSLEGLNKPIGTPFDSVFDQFAELAADSDCRAIINSGFEVNQNRYEILVSRLRKLEACKHRQFLYVDSRSKKRMIWNPGEDAVPIDYHPDQVNKKLACALYGPAQKRGIEFALPKGEKDYGVFMVDLSSTLEEVAQGLYRMRQFGYGQSGSLLPDAKMAKYISKMTGKPVEEITQGDVIKAVNRKTVEADKLEHVKALVFKFKEHLKKEVDEILRMPYDLVGIEDPQTLILFEKIVFKIHRDLYIQTESIDWMKMFSDQTEVDCLEYVEKMLHFEIKRVQKMKAQFEKDTKELIAEMDRANKAAAAAMAAAIGGAISGALGALGGLFGMGGAAAAPAAAAAVPAQAPAAAAPVANPAPKRVEDQIKARHKKLLEGYKRAEAALKVEIDKLKKAETKQYYINNLPAKIPADLDGHANMDMVVEMQVEMQQEMEEEREQEQQAEVNVPQPYFGRCQALDIDDFLSAHVNDGNKPNSATSYFSLLKSSLAEGDCNLAYPSRPIGMKFQKLFGTFHPHISLRAEKFLQTKGSKGDSALFVLVVGSNQGSKSCIITQTDLTNTIGPMLKRLRDAKDQRAIAVLPMTSRTELNFKKEQIEPMYLDSGDVQERSKLKRWGLENIMLFNKFVLDWTNYTQEELVVYESALKDKRFADDLVAYLTEIGSIKTKNLIEKDRKRLVEAGAQVSKAYPMISKDLISKFILDCTCYSGAEEAEFNRLIADEKFATGLREYLKGMKAYHTARKIDSKLAAKQKERAANQNNIDHDDVHVDIALKLRPADVGAELDLDKHNDDYQTQPPGRDRDHKDPVDDVRGLLPPRPAATGPTGGSAGAAVASSALRDIYFNDDGTVDINRTGSGWQSGFKVKHFDPANQILVLGDNRGYKLNATQLRDLPADLRPFIEA